MLLWMQAQHGQARGLATLATAALVALGGLIGCGGSSGEHARAAARRSAPIITAPLVGLSGRSPRYDARLQSFCAAVHGLPQFNVDGDMGVDKEEALAEGPVLGRVQRELASVRIPRSERHRLRAYMRALASERKLDARITVDAAAADEADVEIALEQHTFNSEERTRLAQRLGMGCLVQLNPT